VKIRQAVVGDEDTLAGLNRPVHDMHEARRPDDPFRRARRWCEIDQIAVDPAWRRRRVGRSLMQAALDEAHARGYLQVELSSWAFNADAHVMFRRLGVEPRVVTFERRER
jgi:GNAT superfamily N-acetyltransferase